MSQPKRSRQGNAPSTLLNEHENQKLFSIVGSRSVSLASAVVQVMLAEPPNYNLWSKKCCGVACLIKDNHQRSYYIRVYDLKMKCCIWEQELYNQFKYLGTKPLFHTFEADNCPAGLNFANDNEANQFKKAVDDKLVQRQRRKQERKRATGTNMKGASGPRPVAPTAAQPQTSPVVFKARHVGHVGWDPSKGFDMDNLDPSLKQLFNHVGISVEELQDKETANFIYDFIEKHGGVDAVKQEQTTGESPRPAAPPPQAYTPAPEPYSAAPPAPPPGPPKLPSRGPSAPPPQRPTPSVPSLPPRTDRPGPPPPAPPPMNRSTPARGGPPPPPPSNRSAPAAAPPPAPPPPPPGPPPPPMSGGPPPPPAPPPPGIPPPGPPAPPPPPSNDGRTDLLAAIRNTGNKGGLKHVDADSRSAAPTDSRGALLSQIAQGHALKKVDPSERERPPSSGAEENSGLAGALKKALLDRAGYIQGQSSDEECDVDDDDEWED